MEITVTTYLIGVSSLALVIFLYKVLFGSSNYWKSRGVRWVPGALPFFGNTFSVITLRESMATWTRRVYRENRGSSSMIGFMNATKPSVMVLDPDLVKVVLQTGFKAFQDNEMAVDPKYDPLMANDPFFVRGREWKDSRAVFNTTVSMKRVKLMTEAIERACDKLKIFLKNSSSLEFEGKLLFSRYTSEVATSNVFSIEGHSFDKDTKDTVLESMMTWLCPSVKQTAAFILALTPFSGFLFNSFVPPKTDAYFRRVAKDVEEMKKQRDISSNDVFQSLFDLVKDGKLSRDHALSHAFSFLVESYETSSLTLSFATYSLAKNQTVQDKTRAEVKSVLEKYDGRLTYEAIQELNYTERVINETLRFFPPVGQLAKIAVENHRLEASDGTSLDVEPGMSIIIPVIGLHMDPLFWDNPEVFEPERFTKENVEKRHKFVYLPFGEGPRACPGSRLAIVQIKAVIATLLNDYRIDLSTKMIDPIRFDPSYFLTTALGGFHIKLTPLKNS